MHAIVVGCDLGKAGDQALAAAITLALAEPVAPALLVVHVITQQELDKTAELDLVGKKRVALERAFPAVWKRVEAVVDRAAADAADLSMDVQVRFAPVHLVRAEARIAEELVQAAVDHGADVVTLGPRGRPDCVAEHVLARGTAMPLPDDAPSGAIAVRLKLEGAVRSGAYVHEVDTDE